MSGLRVAGALALVFVCAASGRAAAYDPTTTLSGVAQRAAEAVELHKILFDRFGLPLGQFEPLVLGPKEEALFGEHLELLDPADGLLPERGRLPALSWLLAGAVLESTPAARVRHHFFDPRTGKGLDDRHLGARLWLAIAGGRELGGPFDLTGRPAPEWAAAKDNELGLPAFWAAIEQAAVGKTPNDRASALARALLCAGALTSLVADMASPTHVRNDFRVGHLERLSDTPFDRGSRYETWVARHYGRLGVPGATPIRLPRFADHFKQLAEAVQRGFLSPGTLPPAVAVSARTSAQAIEARLAETTPLAGPAPRGLRLGGGYVAGEVVPFLARLTLSEGRLELTLDDKVHAAYAQVLLPMAVRHASGALAMLLRGSAHISREGVVTVDGGQVLHARVRILVEDAKGERRDLWGLEDRSAAGGGRLCEVDLSQLPAGTKRVVVVARGVDDAGEPIVASGQLAL